MQVDDVLQALAEGRITVEQARARLAGEGLHAVDEWALLDAQREARTGLPEVVLAEGKSPHALHRIVKTLIEERDPVLVSRLDSGGREEADLDALGRVVYDEEARFACVTRQEWDPVPGEHAPRVAVITAGTADRPVAREAGCVLSSLGIGNRMWTDRGVAAPARLAPTLREVLAFDPDGVIVAAGREGALATVVAASVPVPVVGLPVSTGYGHAGQGEAALAAMLQSCSPLSVVNIDAGVTAGLVAARIARRARPVPEASLGDPQGSRGSRSGLSGRQY